LVTEVADFEKLAAVYPGPAVLRAGASGNKISCAIVGFGVRGGEHVGNIGDENVVAIVDVDERQHAALHKQMKAKGLDAGKVQLFTDYRRMFDRIAKQIDAVFVATPNHHHASVSLIAL
jgi:predicted dehydrogenase